MTVPYDFGFDVAPVESDGFFPSEEDMIEWEICDDCGEEYPVVDGLGSCDCHMGYREPSDDFPMYLEYEGPFGLSGSWD